ncbi:hypothetical protein SESBI_04089 [Sesbania bispinosa]|nr:hypothetical protein SESBI_04089 [Sesbania bispinosa]
MKNAQLRRLASCERRIVKSSTVRLGELEKDPQPRWPQPLPHRPSPLSRSEIASESWRRIADQSPPVTVRAQTPSHPV